MSLNGLGSAFEKNTLAFALHRADMLATYVTDNEHFKEAPPAEDVEHEQPEDTADGTDEVLEDDDTKHFDDIVDDEGDGEAVEFNASDYDDWDIEDIKDEIREWGEEPKKRAKRSELLKQLERLMTSDGTYSDVPF